MGAKVELDLIIHFLYKCIIILLHGKMEVYLNNELLVVKSLQVVIDIYCTNLHYNLPVQER